MATVTVFTQPDPGRRDAGPRPARRGHPRRVLLAAPDRQPFTEALDNTRKYVASTTLREPLAWRNSTLLAGDAAYRPAGR